MASPPAALAGETEVVKRAFALKQGELGGPVETPRGIYLLKLKEKQPAAVPPLAKIRALVERAATEDKARELAKKKAEEALAALAKGGAGLKLQDTGNLAYSPKGDIPRIGSSPEIMEAAFSLTAAAPTAKTPFKVADRWYAVRLKNRIAADTADFQKTKEQIKQSMLPKKQQEALDTWIKELKKKAKIELNDALLAD
jgi:peptidyl-prolyl cis-trans isomerase D